ncbi:hypothetical protein EVAR_96653_1 [Eumeta japonica]|uniref:Uncharacterized protein n=1 Tax=Eumeta variegata TaxID=151549 RepID=A0A4C2A0Z2_EUMVA|nr:hypothetical protein EVAR_96653_1 [Eumeta japonica]
MGAKYIKGKRVPSRSAGHVVLLVAVLNYGVPLTAGRMRSFLVATRSDARHFLVCTKLQEVRSQPAGCAALLSGCTKYVRSLQPAGCAALMAILKLREVRSQPAGCAALPWWLYFKLREVPLTKPTGCAALLAVLNWEVRHSYGRMRGTLPGGCTKLREVLLTVGRMRGTSLVAVLKLRRSAHSRPDARHFRGCKLREVPLTAGRMRGTSFDYTKLLAYAA